MIKMYSVAVKCCFKKGLLSSDLPFRKVILAVFGGEWFGHRKC